VTKLLKIARMAVQLADQERPKNNYAEIEHLGQKVQQMVRDTLNAFARTDAEAGTLENCTERCQGRP